MGCFSMPKAVPKKKYTGDFKQMVAETMRNEKPGSSPILDLYSADIVTYTLSHTLIQQW